MDCRIFIKLPVRNVVASSAFYAALGAEWDERLSDGKSALMRFTDDFAVVLVQCHHVVRPVPGETTNGQTHGQALLRLSCKDRTAVDRLARIAGWAGGRTDPHPIDEIGLLYGRSFEDPDGHVWEAVWIDDPAAMAPRERMQAA
jgi:predicted lactoylglutathione lyase